MNDEKSAELSELLQSMQEEGAGPVSLTHAREAILIEQEELPWVELTDGSGLKLLQVDLNQNLWIVKNRFKPGFCIDTH